MGRGRGRAQAARSAVAGGLALALLGFGSAAAAAPPEDGSGTIVLPVVNPCTGATEAVTSDFTSRVIRTNGSFVQVIEGALTTSAGGVGRSRNVIVVNRSNQVGPINAVVDYPDGSRVKVLLLVDGDLARGGEVTFENAVCVQPA